MNFIIYALLLMLLMLAVLVLVLKTLYLQLGVVEAPVNVHQKPQYLPQVPELSLLLFVVTSLVVVNYFKVDFLLAGWIYQHSEWFYQESFIANGILHKFAKVFLMVVYLYLLIKLLVKFKKTGKSHAVYDLSIMLLAVILSVSFVSLLKRFLAVDCPWDLLVYGGSKPFFPLFNYPVEYMPSANCFPASHASVGYSWIAGYFYFSVNNSLLKYKALIAALLMGLLFGITQQLRGAHFISHDLTSLLICLITSMSVYSVAYRIKSPVKYASQAVEY